MLSRKLNRNFIGWNYDSEYNIRLVHNHYISPVRIFFIILLYIIMLLSFFILLYLKFILPEYVINFSLILKQILFYKKIVTRLGGFSCKCIHMTFKYSMESSCVEFCVEFSALECLLPSLMNSFVVIRQDDTHRPCYCLLMLTSVKHGSSAS